MKNKLKSMVDYVLEFPATHDYKNALSEILTYAFFLNQKPEIWMFVPCRLVSGVWVVLKHPIEPEHPYNDKKCDVWEQYLSYLNRYQEAKEACIFEEFEHCICNNEISVRKRGFTPVLSSEMEHMTIEDLVKYNITLTDKQAKRLGL